MNKAQKKIIIVGGVAGGASAAARIRRLDEAAEIIMLEKGEYISFANCGLPYHIGGAIVERERLLVQTPASMHSRFRVDVRNFSEAVSINTKEKTITIQSKERGVYEENYDVLVLAPGVEAGPLPIVNHAPGRVFSLRNIPDMDAIKEKIENENIYSAAIIGGGFIGLEMAEALKEKGLTVTLVEAMEHIMPPLDKEMAVLLEAELKNRGVSLRLGAKISSIEEENGMAVVALDGQEAVRAALVISAIGVRPATGFLKDSGVQLGSRGHILTDAHLRTNAKDVYAVGDAIEVVDFVTGAPAAIPLAGPANKQGRIAADNICGLNHSYKGTQGSSVIKLFGLTAASTGANARTLERLNIPYTAIYTHPFSHATYYPGAAQMSCKLLFAPDSGNILGCQIVGEKGVEKRVDVVATAMRLHATAASLCELELCYAPPYSSAKDPVNMLGYMALNILEGKANIVDYRYMLNRNTEETFLLDVRTPGEFARGHVAGAVNIPVDELRARLEELPKDKEIIEYCQVGIRGHVAERILTNHGFRAVNVSGGWKTISTMLPE
ncbi:FAD-dependent oxidoreductase [Christensenellaceae bacterium OttesenSCG-928-L17]|nr:FAD-dependent oxidoreductase [Christensenellaceae bacterium OttesenSCG-928-L17]